MRRRWSFRNARQAPFELWISVVCLVNIAGYFTRPTANPIHQLIAPWDTVWAVIYGLAGLCIFVGLVRERSSQIEALGLGFLIAGIAVQLVVFASLGVATLNGTWATLVSLGSLGVIALWRLRTMFRISHELGELDE